MEVAVLMSGWSGTPAQMRELAQFRVRDVDAESTPAYKILAAAIVCGALVLMLTGALG
jgi:hypothetical protein